jgi:hypothetical protein
VYKLNYDKLTGKVSSIQNGNMSIPIAEDNTDFQAFLLWNEQQAIPLDWHTPIAVEPPPVQTEVTFDLPVHAPDFIVSSPKIPTDRKQALTEAVSEGKKANKSIAFMVMALTHYVEELESRVSKLEKGKP